MVNKLLFSATIVASGLSLFTVTAMAQAPAGQPGAPPANRGNYGPAMGPAPASGGTRISSPVGVIDMLYIFENHETFKLRKAELDGRKEATEKQLITQRDNFKAKMDRLKEWKPGSPEFSKLESELAQDEAKMKVDVKKLNEQFIMEEGKMYYATYQEVLEEVKRYAAQMNMLLVLRYTGGEVHVDNPEEIMKEMNEQVVYYNKAIDITGAILNQLNSRRPPQVGARPQTRPVTQGVPR